MDIEKLYKLIKDRIKTLPEDSYIASLYKEGEDRIIQKVGEEAVEAVIAAKGKDKKRIIEEVADLWFMTLVLMAVKGITPMQINEELKRRRRKSLKNK